MKLFFAFCMLFTSSFVFAYSAGNKLNSQEYVYDVAVDGGTAGAYVLSSKDNKKVLPDDAVVKSVTAWVETAVNGSGTLSWGNTASTTVFGNAVATGTLVKDYVVEYETPFVVAGTTTANFIATTSATMTAGKVHFMVDFFTPEL
jgi:hypothetical protein